VDSLASRINANREKTEANLKEIITEMGAWGKEAAEACLESKEPTSESVAAHKEVLKEETAMQTVRALKKRYGDRHLAVGRRRQLQKRTEGKGGSRTKLAAARRGMARSGRVARRNGRGHTGPKVEEKRREKWTRNIVARGTSKGRRFAKRRRVQQEYNNGIRN
jgi:hypothetical protein